MYKGMIQFTIDIKESELSNTSTTYELSITDTKMEFVKKSICACVKLLDLIGAKNIDCNFIYDPRREDTNATGNNS